MWHEQKSNYEHWANCEWNILTSIQWISFEICERSDHLANSLTPSQNQLKASQWANADRAGRLAKCSPSAEPEGEVGEAGSWGKNELEMCRTEVTQLPAGGPSSSSSSSDGGGSSDGSYEKCFVAIRSCELPLAGKSVGDATGKQEWFPALAGDNS